MYMNISLKVISVLAGILVGLLVTSQFLTKTPISSSFPLDQIQAQKDLIKTYTDEEAFLSSRIVSLREKIDENLEQNETISQTANLERLNKLKEVIGLSEITGEGFMIKLDDSTFIDRETIEGDDGGIVFAADIRDVVNLLRAHGVDGLAINEQRIIATSSITSVGNTVLVDNSQLAPPFNISVIGDFESLLFRLEDPTVLTDLQKRVKENGIQFGIKKMQHVVLPIYNGQFRLKFIQTPEEISQ